MLILILLGIQYLKNDVFSIEKGFNGQNHYFSGPHYPIKKSPPQQNFCLGGLHLQFALNLLEYALFGYTACMPCLSETSPTNLPCR